MSQKDKYDNNLRRGARVKDNRDDDRGYGIVEASGNGNDIVVSWEKDGEEETLDGRDVILADRRFGGRGR